MKNLFFLFIMTFFMGACAYKNEAVNLESYRATSAQVSSQTHTHLYLAAVTDEREDKTSIGTVQADKKAVAKLYSNTDFATKYEEGLKSALKMADFNVTQELTSDVCHVVVKIKKIELLYNDTKKLDENLHGKIIIEMRTTHQNQIVIQTFTQEQGTWIKPSYSSKDVEPLLYKLFETSINDIVAKLTRF